MSNIKRLLEDTLKVYYQVEETISPDIHKVYVYKYGLCGDCILLDYFFI